MAAPGWKGDVEGASEPSTNAHPHQPTQAVIAYSAVSSAIAIVPSTLLIVYQEHLTLLERIVGVGLVIWTLAATGRLLDGARWARRYELVRVVALLAFSYWSWHSARLG